MKIVAFGAELSVTLMLAGGLGFTVREFRRLSAESEGRNALVVGSANVAMDVIPSPASEVRRQHALRGEELAPSDKVAAVESNDEQKAVSYSRYKYSSFESTWLARLLENEDSSD